MDGIAVIVSDAVAWAVGLSAGAQFLVTTLIALLALLIPGVRALLIGLERRVSSLFRTKPAFPRQRPTRRVIGRDGMLADIHESLTAGKIGVIAPPATVTGGPGVGKTTIAREYRSRHGAEFDRCKILDAEQPENLLAQIGALFGDLDGKLRGRAMAALARIEDDTARKWLLIYDNVPSPEAVADLIPYAGHVKALITTRAHNWPEASFRVFPADYLTPEDALTLLLETAGRVDDADPDAAELVEDLGRLPIGLVQAGESLLANPAASFAQYRARLLEFLAERPGFGPSDVDYPMTVVAAISLSLDQTVEDEGEDVAALLDLLPWLAPEGMDARLVLDVAGSDRPKDDIPGAIRALADHPARVQAAISALARRSLAVVVGEGADRTVTLHRITAQILRARQDADAHARRRAAAAVVAASYPGDPENHSNWPACRRLNPHVAALATHVPDGEGEALRPHAAAALDFLLNQASVFHRQQASTDIALSHARMALRLKIARLGPDDPAVGTGHGNLGLSLAAAGLWAKAVAAMREALRIAEAQGPDDRSLGVRLSNLASALRGQADAGGMAGAVRIARLREVEALFRRAYEHDRRLHGALDDRTASRLSNLAGTYDALGDRRRARRIAALALATFRKVLAPGDPRLATPLNNLGSYHLKDCAPDRALPLLKEAFRILDEAYGDNRRPGIRIATARWLATCRLALPEPDAAGARALCAQYDIDYDDIARRAARYRP